jgi:hypothetical protein
LSTVSRPRTAPGLRCLFRSKAHSTEQVGLPDCLTHPSGRLADRFWEYRVHIAPTAPIIQLERTAQQFVPDRRNVLVALRGKGDKQQSRLQVLHSSWAFAAQQ